MNMNDLKALAAQKAAAATGTQPEFPELPEDSPELKTPTAEDIMVPEQKVNRINAISLCSSNFYSIRTHRQLLLKAYFYSSIPLNEAKSLIGLISHYKLIWVAGCMIRQILRC